MRKRSSDSIRKNEFLTQNLTKLTKSAFKHISERNFSEKKFKSKTDTPRVSDADSDELKYDLRTISFEDINKVNEPLKKIDILLEFNKQFKEKILIHHTNKE